MFPHLLETITAKGYKGLVLEGSGIGQAPINIKENLPNYQALKKFIAKGGIVVLTSNCVFGRVHPYIYKNCRRLEEMGVIFGEDMLTETAFIKLAWLLGNYPKKEVPRLIKENLRGEISTRTLYEKNSFPFGVD
jgi:glutamyl-tRNA(Gln) amidotransferase subunit D